MTRIIIDTDPGVDDAHALMMALAHPEAEIDALTTVSGNVPVELTTANALKILEVFDREVPVYPGCQDSIVAQEADASYIHGRDGLGDSGIPPAQQSPEGEHAVLALMRLADESPGEITLIAIGPLTNVAMATRLDPELPGKYKQLIVMGGAIRAMGNTPNLCSEFNLFTDPEAGAIVFDAWEKFSLISWETTVAHPFSADQIEQLGSYDNPRSQFFKSITANTVNYIQQILGRKMLFAPDPLAVAVALEPGIVTASERHFTTVELGGRQTRGQTVVDWFDSSKQPANAELILEVDHDRLWELMQAAVA